MTDRNNGALERATQRGALTRRGTGDLVSRGLVDIERSERSEPAAIPVAECYKRGERLYLDAEGPMSFTLPVPAASYRKYAEAAEQGDADAQDRLGEMYHLGRGVPEDDTEAVRWYHLAADQGHTSVQLRLGVMYLNGWGSRRTRPRRFGGVGSQPSRAIH